MTSVCRWTYSSTALSFYLRKWTLDYKGLLARIWTARLSLWVVIVDLLTLTITIENYPRFTALPIPDHSTFQTLPFQQSRLLLRTRFAFPPFHSLCLTLQLYFKTQAWQPFGCLVSIPTVFKSKSFFPCCFWELWTTVPAVCLTLALYISKEKLGLFMPLKKTGCRALFYTKKRHSWKTLSALVMIQAKF